MRDRVNINEAYSILGLKPGASQSEVKQAYRKLVKTWHPDRFGDRKLKLEAEEKIKLINEAYNKLKFYQPTTKQSYQTTQKKHSKVYSDRSNAETFYNWGVENAKQGRYEEALTDFTHAIRINPHYVEAYKYRGFICSQLGYEYRANSDLSKAAKLEREYRNKHASNKSPSSRPSTSTRESKPKSLLERFFQWVKRLLRLKRR